MLPAVQHMWVARGARKLRAQCNTEAVRNMHAHGAYAPEVYGIFTVEHFLQAICTVIVQTCAAESWHNGAVAPSASPPVAVLCTWGTSRQKCIVILKDAPGAKYNTPFGQ